MLKLLASLFFPMQLCFATTIYVTTDKIVTDSSKTGGTHYLFDEKELQKNGGDLRALLKTIPGIHIPSTGGGTQSIFSRGSNSNHTTVLLDDIPIIDPSSPSEAVDLSQVPLEGVEKIEIAMGPQSVLYGSGAVGAVIKITTKNSGQDKKTIEGAISNRNSFFIRPSLISNKSSSSLKLSYDKERSHFKSGVEKDEINTAVFNFGKRYSLFKNKGDFSIKLIHQKLDLDEFAVDDANKKQTQTNIHLSQKVNYIDKKSFFELDLITGFSYFSRKDIDEQDINDSKYEATLTRGHHLFLSLPAKFYINENNTLLAGVDLSYLENHSTHLSLRKNTRSLTGIYLLHKFEDGGFFTSTGIREELHSNKKNIFTYKLAPGYSITPTGTTFKASISRSFKSPTLHQLYHPTSGNNRLQPEKATSGEISLSQDILDVFSTSITHFQTNYTDLISFGPAPDYINGNVSKAKVSGYEFMVNTKNFNHQSYLEFSYEKISAKDLTTNKNLVRRPFENLNFNLYHHISSTMVSIINSYLGPREDYAADNNQHRMGGIFKTDLFLKKGNYYLNIENIFDKDYVLVPTYTEKRRTFTIGMRKAF